MKSIHKFFAVTLVLMLMLGTMLLPQSALAHKLSGDTGRGAEISSRGFSPAPLAVGSYGTDYWEDCSKADYASCFDDSIDMLTQTFGFSSEPPIADHAGALELGIYDYQMSAAGGLYIDPDDVVTYYNMTDFVLTFSGELPKSVCLGVIASNMDEEYIPNQTLYFSVNGTMIGSYTTKENFSENALIIYCEDGISTVTLHAIAQNSYFCGLSYLYLPDENVLPDMTVLPEFVGVSNIYGIPISMGVGVDLTLSGTVEPGTATNKAIVWSVKDTGTTGAALDGDVLSATAVGTVIITATVENGLSKTTNYTQDFTIAVINATSDGDSAKTEYASWLEGIGATMLEQRFGTNNVGDAYAHEQPFSLGIYQYQLSVSVNDFYADAEAIFANYDSDDITVTFTGTLPKSVCLGITTIYQSLEYFPGREVNFSVNGAHIGTYTSKQDLGDNALMIFCEEGISSVTIHGLIPYTGYFQGLSYLYLPSVNELPAPLISTATLPDGKVGQAYSQALEAAGKTPVTWSVAGGTLPNGLVLTDDGVISGTPAVAGSFSFTVEARNSFGSDTQALSIKIASASTTPPTTRSTPTTSAYVSRTLTDSATGVTLSGKHIHKDAKLKVSALEPHAAGCAACDEIRAAKNQGAFILGYDISFSDDLGYAGPFTLSIPVGAQYNGKTVAILHCVNGRLERHVCTVENGLATFEVDSLSPFAVVASAYAQSAINVPATGGAASLTGFALIALSAACAALGAWRRRT